MNKSLNLNEFAEQCTLSVFVNNRQEPMGVLIPLKQWVEIAPSVAKNCEAQLVYFGLDSIAASIERVKLRVEMGGA